MFVMTESRRCSN